jgi:uncharacterized membrane protein YkoI
MKHTLATLFVTGSLMTAGSLFAATNNTAAVKSDVPADLAKEAKISLETARAMALAKVRHGVVRSEELEREHGKLIYSFDIAVPGKSGIQEVNVNAIDGKVLGVHHETAKDEKKEAAKEHKPAGR